MPCSIILHSSLETGSLVEHGSRLTSSKAPAILCHLSPECMLSSMCVSWATFYMGAGYPNAGTHASAVSDGLHI